MFFLRKPICFLVSLLMSLNLYPKNIAGNTGTVSETQKPVMRFVVCSDIHMEDSPSCRQYGRLEKLFTDSYKYAASQPYSTIDAFVFVGDIINYGTKAQADNVNAVVNKYKKAGTPLMCVYDNHDIGDGSTTIAQCEKWFGVPANEDRVINGFHFITASYDGSSRSYATRLPSLYKQLSDAKKEDPKKPIFVFNHRNIEGTVYGSTDWGTFELSPVLNNFPQVIDFSGHSHYPINDPRSCSQYFFTSFNCGTLSYAELEAGMSYGTVPPDAEGAAQFYIVEVYADNSVAVKPFNIMTDDFFKVPSSTSGEQLIYYITNPSDRSGFTYTNARYLTADIPVWPKDAKTEMSGVTSTGATVTFTQALDGEEVHSYTVTLKIQGIVAGIYKFWSDFYLEPMPATMSWTFKDLYPNTKYTVEINAYDTYMNQTKAPLTASFKTAAE
jgi:hypothetical protein